MRLEYFQMLDGLESLDLEKATITAKAHVPMESTVFEGHFPGYPIVPGVLLTETMAQASGYLAMALCGFERMMFLAKVKEANFRNFVMPGTEMTVEAARVHDGSGYAVMQASLRNSDKKLADAQITLRLLPFANDALKSYVRSEAERIGLNLLVQTREISPDA
jgi:3-hydroxyacyl-[acyl-carrier-protein] dehydratase